MTMFEPTPVQRVRPQAVGQAWVTCLSLKLGNGEGLIPSESYGVNVEGSSFLKKIEML